MTIWRTRAVKAVNTVLGRTGFALYHGADLLLEGALSRLVRHGIPVATLIDVGASDGRWCARAERFFPDAAQLLVDANPAHEPALRLFCAARKNSHYAITAAGRGTGTIWFDATSELGGVAYNSPHPGLVEVPVHALDTLVAQYGVAGPYLLKLDTHGYEVPILEGAANVLAACSVLCIEAYNFRLSADSLRFYELCALLETHGFRPLDIIQPMHRPLDGAFWQMDILFARADSAVFATDAYA